MTTAKIKAKLPADGNGLTPRLAEGFYDLRAKGAPTEELIIVGRLAAIGHGEENGKGTVTFEFKALEVVAEDWERANVRDILTNASEKRHGSRQLPLDFAQRNDEEQRQFLFGLIDEWAAEEDKTPGELAETWRDYFGIDDATTDTPAGYAPVDYRKADAHRLREFCLSVGVLADEPVTGGSDEDDDAEALPEGLAEPVGAGAS